MKPLRPAWMLVPLALAGGAALWWPEENGSELSGSTPAPASSPRPTRVEATAANPRDTPDTPEDSLAPGEAVKVRGRLRELTVDLGLTADQRREVHRLLVRAAPGYENAASGALGEGSALSRVEADERIHALLDPVQQAEFEEILLDRDLWWSEVIDRLQRDLEASTDPAEAFGGIPNEPTQDPGPEPQPEPEPAPAVPAPHRGGNLFDLINPPSP